MKTIHLILIVLILYFLLKKKVEPFQTERNYLSDYFLDNYYRYSNSSLDTQSNYATIIPNTQATTSQIDLNTIDLTKLNDMEYANLVALLKGAGQVQLEKVI